MLKALSGKVGQQKTKNLIKKKISALFRYAGRGPTVFQPNIHCSLFLSSDAKPGESGSENSKTEIMFCIFSLTELFDWIDY
ncbi:hypothetical protein [endosymbiont GvMRE of Glomus versiforme]|uniref:hypothetical protein n=1 Tax=endosymbiont GvMRE of Glomus versiforme TaxID=2039283 RepID=UPI0011C3435F|nr:hypothetical protein [endosymbiont GvMRE of Glomus versiforme]